MAEDIRYRVIVDENYTGIYRTGDSNIENLVGVGMSDYTFIVTKISDDKKYYYVPAYGGWIKVTDVTIEDENVPKSENENIVSNITTSETIPATEQLIAPSPDRILDATGTNTLTTSSGLENLSYTSASGVFGMPYQFMSRVDRRLDGTDFGRKFADKIVARNNLLYITPGKQMFLNGASNDEKAAILSRLADMATGGDGGGLSADTLTTCARYYSLGFEYANYFDYVNPACWAVASLLDLSNVEYNGKKLYRYDWADNLDSSFGSVIGASNNIVFYVDGLNESSEDFGNDTRESSLISTINGYSDTIKEINYIMNYEGGSAANLDDSNYAATLSNIQGVVDNFVNGKGVLQAILGNTSTILSGGKLVFPELWSDSSFDRSFSVNIKLRSPESDPLSIYLNIIVPFIHLMALTAPRDFEGMNNSNGYVAPFLVRAFFRGILNIDMGIVTSLSVTRGGEGNWSLDSLPTAVDVSLTIKDLYKSMYMAKGTDAGLLKFVANDGEMDYLMNLAGVNVSQESFQRRLSLYSALAGGSVGSFVSRIGTKLENEFTEIMRGIYGR